MVAASVVSGATYAVFSATDSIDDNTITTATITFDAKGEANATTLAKPLNASGLLPGEFTDWARGALYNQSAVPVRFYMYVDNLDGAACPLINLRVTTGHAGSDAGERARDVFNDPLLDLAGAANRIQVTGAPPFATAGPNITQVIQQRAQLDESAGNGSQGQSCTWDEIFIAEGTPEEE